MWLSLRRGGFAAPAGCCHLLALVLPTRQDLEGARFDE